MSIFYKPLATAAALGLLLTLAGCGKQVSQEALAAQESAKAADARVAALEQQLADLKAGKHAPAKGDRATADHVSKSQAKALERQLADARKGAETKHKVAEELAAAPAPPASAPKPVVVEVPEGTPLTVRLAAPLSTAAAQAGDGWEGTLAEDVTAGSRTVWKAGAPVHGVVTQSTPAGRLSSGQGGLGIKLTQVAGEDIDTAAYVMVGDKRGTRNAKFIGGGAAVGALIGILSDNRNQGDHALGGAALGAAAGTAAAAATADTAIKIPADKAITFTLAAAEKVTLKP